MSDSNFDKYVDNYFKKLKNYKPLSKEEERGLLIKYKTENDLEARNKLITCNLKFACGLASKYVGRGLSYSELISEANDGLIEAIERFDYVKNNVKLIWYAKFWIIHKINTALSQVCNSGKFTQLPEYRFTTNEDGVVVDFTEFSDIDGYQNDIYISEEYNVTDEMSCIEQLSSCLTQREIDILYMYYGINHKSDYRLEDIANKYKLTKERVRQILENSFRKLRSEAIVSSVQFR